MILLLLSSEVKKLKRIRVTMENAFTSCNPVFGLSTQNEPHRIGRSFVCKALLVAVSAFGNSSQDKHLFSTENEYF